MLGWSERSLASYAKSGKRRFDDSSFKMKVNARMELKLLVCGGAGGNLKKIELYAPLSFAVKLSQKLGGLPQ
jgi:hypothetical protein